MCFSNKTERVFVNYAKKKRTIKIWRLVYKRLCLKYFIFVACFKLLNHTIRVTSVFLDKLGGQKLWGMAVNFFGLCMQKRFNWFCLQCTLEFTSPVVQKLWFIIWNTCIYNSLEAAFYVIIVYDNIALIYFLSKCFVSPIRELSVQY